MDEVFSDKEILDYILSKLNDICYCLENYASTKKYEMILYLANKIVEEIENEIDNEDKIANNK